MKPIHSIILSTTKRTNSSDNEGDCWVPLDINLKGEQSDNVYIQMVSSSAIGMTNPTDIVVFSSSIRQPYSWDSVAQGETGVLGHLAPSLTLPNGVIHTASTTNNAPVPCILPKSGSIHLRLLNYLTNEIISDQDYCIHLLVLKDE